MLLMNKWNNVRHPLKNGYKNMAIENKRGAGDFH